METLHVGVLGGTFDPVHNGHIFVAEYVRAHLGLDRVYFVTAKLPPHKSHHMADAEVRHAMVEAAVKDKPHLVPCRLELDRAGTSYTVDTFRQLQASLGPDVRLNLIISAEYLNPDSPSWLKNWEEAAELFKLCRIVVTPRRHMDASIARDWAALLPDADIIIVDLPSPSVSSLMVKRQLKRQLPIDDLVPPAVAQLMIQQNIYSTDTVVDSPTVSSPAVSAPPPPVASTK